MTDGSLPPAFLRRTQRSRLPPAVILGAFSVGVSLARALARHGVPVLGIHGTRPRPAGYSSAWEIAKFPALYQDELAGFLPGIAEAAGQKPMLIPTHDLLVDIVARHRELLAASFLFELPEYSVIRRFRSKNHIAEEAVRHGWLVPATRFVRNVQELRECAQTLTFPVIIKPDLGTLAFRTRSPRKASVCTTHQELERVYAEFSQWESDVVVQEWISGGDDEVYFSLHYFTQDLRELGRFAGRKIRQWPPLCGNTSAAVPFPDSGISDSAGRLLASAGCAGFGSVEYKRDPRSGQYLITEPTVGRPDSQTGLALGNGVDLVSRAYSHLTGIALPEGSPPARPRRWIAFAEDRKAARHYHRMGQLTVGGYLRSLRGPRIYAVWHPRDLRMYPSLIRGFLGFWAELVVARTRRLLRR